MKHAGRLAAAAGALRILAGGTLAPSGAVVLAYHDVVADARCAVELSVSGSMLRHHVAWMRRFGMRLVSVGSLLDALEAGHAVDGLAVVTFDDALRGVHGRALPILAELAVPATVFVVADRMGRTAAWWPEAGRSLSELELGDLVDAGWTIGSHTCTHRSLPELTPTELDTELRASRAALEELTGRTVDLLAYPSGRHDAAVRAAAKDAGYRAAFGFVNGRVTPSADRYALPRLCMSSRQHRARLAYHLARPASSWPPDPYLARRVSEGSGSRLPSASR